jgi:hypothetical protein
VRGVSRRVRGTDRAATAQGLEDDELLADVRVRTIEGEGAGAAGHPLELFVNVAARRYQRAIGAASVRRGPVTPSRSCSSLPHHLEEEHMAAKQALARRRQSH